MLDQIAAAVAENESLSDYELHVLMAPDGGYDKVATKTLLSLVSPQRTERVFVKISNSERLSGLLQNEANSLNACQDLGIEGIPKVLACGSIEDRYFLAQRFMPGSRMHSRPDYLDEAIARTKEWLAALYGKTKGPQVDSGDLIRRTKEHAKLASDFFDLGDCIDLLERLSPRTPIPTFRIHGDFWHGNILVDGTARVCVTDFAFSAPGEPPIDHLDLISDYDPGIFLDAGRLFHYSGLLSTSTDELLFLHLYAQVRKIGLKVDRRKKLYEELLLNNLESSMNEIREVGVAKRVVRHLGTKRP